MHNLPMIHTIWKKLKRKPKRIDLSFARDVSFFNPPKCLGTYYFQIEDEYFKLVVKINKEK